MRWWQLIALLKAHDPVHQFLWSATDRTDANAIEMAAPPSRFDGASKIAAKTKI